jgi:hypothetical protein
MRFRHLTLFAAGLALLAAVAWMSQQRSAVGDAVVSSGGVPDAAPVEVQVAPVAAAVAPTSPSGPTVDAGWVRRTAAAAGISERAVAAYGAATLGLDDDCHLGWTTLAGIGWVESHHGTTGDRTLGADGRPSTPILGPALDGHGFAAIPATPESTALHGNPDWDHAMGPMQFIPSTWATWGRDGDGDGTADPQDIDDAAAAAAAYLCGTGYDVTSGEGWSQAVFAYNHSAEYVNAVYAAAAAYGERTAR